MTELVRYDEMCRAIEACHAVDEIKGMRDRAMAVEHYAKQALDHESEHKVIRIRLRAERRMGQLLKEMEKAAGARGTGSNQHRKVRSNDTTPPTLSDLGISKTQSSHWQKLADVPEDKFEKALADMSAPPSTAGIIRQYGEEPAAPDPPPAPPGFVKATQTIGAIADFSELCRENKPGFVAEGVLDYEIAELKTNIATVADWLNRFALNLREPA